VTWGIRARACAQLAALLIGCGGLLGPSASAIAQGSIARTVHNLTPSGPGTQTERSPTGLCVFCHTPHNSNPTQALWNRNMSGVTYQLYASSSMQATVQQPTGSSRMCLSCHDGIIAMSNVWTPLPGSTMTLGALTGPTVVGNDLRNTHPISFVYDSALAAKRGNLLDPIGLAKTLPLDASRQLQCTTCHNPHESRYPNFLRMDNSSDALCLVCHLVPLWSGSSHAMSFASPSAAFAKKFSASSSSASRAATDPKSATGPKPCSTCHRPHAAGHGERLLAQAVETENCTLCHAAANPNGSKNVTAEFSNGAKFSRHPIEKAQWAHKPGENPATMPRHVTCADCHNVHAATSASGPPGSMPGPLKGVAGISVSGMRTTAADAEYQVCIKCHDMREPSTPGAARVESTRSVRAKINPGNASYHPIASVGRNSSIRGLTAGYTASSVITCTDCHNNSDSGPRGAHASRFAPILERNYSATDPTPETPMAYDICYKCHDRNAILSDSPGTFPHRIHVVKSQASCAACHDAHGSRQNAHLINFMARDSSNRTVVSANSAGRLDYATTGPAKGTCYLKCHGVEHNPLGYGIGASAPGRAGISIVGPPFPVRISGR